VIVLEAELGQLTPQGRQPALEPATLDGEGAHVPAADDVHVVVDQREQAPLAVGQPGVTGEGVGVAPAECVVDLLQPRRVVGQTRKSSAGRGDLSRGGLKVGTHHISLLSGPAQHNGPGDHTTFTRVNAR